MESMYRSVLACFIDDRYLDGSPVANIENYLQLHQIDLGPIVNADLRMLSMKNLKGLATFRTQCLNFLKQLGTQIYQRFPFRDRDIDTLQFCGFIEPTNIGMDVIAVDQEYKDFRPMFMNDVTISDESRFWTNVKKYVNGNDEPVFKNIPKLRDRISIYHHSSAAYERIFSIVTLNKNKTRNRIEDELTNGLLFGKNTLKMEDNECFSFCPTSQYYEHFNKKMYSGADGS